MKKTFLIISSLALFATVTSAATPETEIPQLPTQVVQAPRFTPAEKAIETGLAELRASARILPVILVHPGLPEREIARNQGEKLPAAATSALTLRVAVKA